MFICGTDWFAFFSVEKIQRNTNKNTGSRVTRCDRTDLEQRYRDIENNYCICASLSKIVDRIRHERGEAPRAGLPKIIYTTDVVIILNAIGKIRTSKV